MVLAENDEPSLHRIVATVTARNQRPASRYFEE
jgi:hypothetical protein